ncbi:MAG: type II toxin-antitoxin system VapC family toxin [Deltaproteobacteria bacterium]|nr:type II toxin-antitoxin system VapC family toxin [Deltaproteobacteria bacterium]
MNCYVDSSVLLRVLFEEPKPLVEWGRIAEAVSSRLLQLECFRVIHRGQITGQLTYAESIDLLARCRRLLQQIGILPVTELVLQRAEQQFLSPVGSLDAIHLASAMAWKNYRRPDLFLATHDTQLATAAHAHGLKVIGV